MEVILRRSVNRCRRPTVSNKHFNPKATCFPKQKVQNCFKKEQLINRAPLLPLESHEMRSEHKLGEFVMGKSPVTLSRSV